MKNLLIILDSKMVTPTNYGWFHLLSLIILVIITILLCKKFKKPSNSQIKKILLVMSLICISLEIYKQINFSFNYDTVKTWWYYQWYAFPFQFCSVPMYVALIAGLTKNRKLETYLYSFLATYGLIAGIAVMLYPNNVFVSTIGVNIQTMVHHGLMVVIGIFLLVTKTIKPNYKTFFKSFVVFCTMVFIALIADIVTYYIGIDGGLKLFYISPFHKSILPVFSSLYGTIPYPLFLLTYIASFSLGSLIIIFIYKCFNRGDKKHEKN